MVPYGDTLFTRLTPTAPVDTPAAGTRRNDRLQRGHPFPVEAKDISLLGTTVPASSRSHVALMAKMWNEPSLPSEVFDNYGKFCFALFNYDWKNCSLTRSLFHRDTDFFGDPAVFGTDGRRTNVGAGIRPLGTGGGRVVVLPEVFEDESVSVSAASGSNSSSSNGTLSAVQGAV